MIKNNNIRICSFLVSLVVGFFLLPLNTQAVSYNAGVQTSTFTATTPQGTRTYQLYVWYPTTEVSSGGAGGVSNTLISNAQIASGSFPTLVFAHGVGSCANQSIFITESLARAGYVVAGINYADASTACGGTTQNEPDFASPTSWNSNTYVARNYDTKALVEYLQTLNTTNSSFTGSLNMSKLGFVGHSLGGYTGAGLAGGWDSWYDSRFKAMLLVAPYIDPYYYSSTIPNIKVPVMVQGGVNDLGITPTLQRFYSALKFQKYYLLLKSAGHTAWTNTTCSAYTNSPDCVSSDEVAQAVMKYGQSFLDTYVAGTNQVVDTTTSSILYSYTSDTSYPQVNINSFTVADASITSGNKTVLSWSTSNGNTVSISPTVGVVNAVGSIEISPATTTTYTITVSNTQSTVSQNVTVVVLPALTAPTINSLSANITSVNKDQPITLTWVVSGNPAPSVSVSNVGSVSGASVIVFPATTTTYVVTATNTQGSASSSIIISVMPTDVIATTTPIISTTTPVIATSSTPVAVPTTQTFVTLTRYLYQGVVNDEVFVLQNFLKQKGFLATTVSSTRYFGSLTESAVRKYQVSKGITPTGTVGAITRGVINKDPITTSVLTPTTTPVVVIPRTLIIGMRHADVVTLQNILKRLGFFPASEISSGYFGSLTRKAVQDFQRAYGIVSSGTESTTGYGMVGKITWMKLLSL